MIYSYAIKGMTCGGCKATIEKALVSLSKVQKVSVDLKHSELTIKTDGSMSIEALQRSLPKKYQLSVSAMSKNEGDDHQDGNHLKQLFPLFLIFLYITAGSLLINHKSLNMDEVMLDFMGLFYTVFSFFKLLDLKGFPESFKKYDPIAKAFPFYGLIYPFMEVVLGMMFLMRFQILAVLVVTLVILGATTVGVTKVLLDKKNISCACLGTALKLPMTKATFVENSIMIVMALVLLLKMILFNNVA